MKESLKATFFNNSLEDYLYALSITLICFVVIRIFKSIIFKRIKIFSVSSNAKWDDFIVNSIEKFVIPALYFVAIYIGINYLTLSTRVQNIIHIALTVIVTVFILRLLSSIILLLLENNIRKQERGEEKVKQIGGLMIIINIVIWIIGLIFLFDNMGYDVTAVVTGLGIGGIAVALAAQNILGDLFNYFVIFFDKPFEVGDFIIIDDKMGVVDYIGIKTTRIKSLSGEQLIFANSDLTNSRIHNYKRMERRRALFKVGVEYETSIENLKEIPVILKSAVEQHENVQLDRAHFASYGDFSLNFEVVYYVLSSDFNIYMDIQQNINLYILKEFKARGIEFAFPSQSLYLKQLSKENNGENNVKEIHKGNWN